MILAVDTSIGSTIAVVSPAGEVLAEANSPSPRGHAEVIGDLLVSVLERAGIGPDAVTHVAAGMGPGPFTGLRIGIAAARAFATGRGIPVVPVASHGAAALARAEEAAGAFAIVTDARRRENAVSVYRGLDDAGLPVRVSGPALHAQTEDLAAALPGVELVHTGAAPAEASASGRDDGDPAGSALGSSDSPGEDAASVIRAADLGRVAARMLAAGVEPHETEPLYLRSPDVTVNLTRKRVST